MSDIPENKTQKEPAVEQAAGSFCVKKHFFDAFFLLLLQYTLRVIYPFSYFANNTAQNYRFVEEPALIGNGSIQSLLTELQDLSCESSPAKEGNFCANVYMFYHTRSGGKKQSNHNLEIRQKSTDCLPFSKNPWKIKEILDFFLRVV